VQLIIRVKSLLLFSILFAALLSACGGSNDSPAEDETYTISGQVTAPLAPEELAARPASTFETTELASALAAASSETAVGECQTTASDGSVTTTPIYFSDSDPWEITCDGELTITDLESTGDVVVNASSIIIEGAVVSTQLTLNANQSIVYTDGVTTSEPTNTVESTVIGSSSADSITIGTNSLSIISGDSAINQIGFISSTGSGDSASEPFIWSSINGGEGSDTLASTITEPTNWSINGDNSGDVSSENTASASFTQIESLIGGTSIDTFTLTDEGALSGSISGGINDWIVSNILFSGTISDGADGGITLCSAEAEGATINSGTQSGAAGTLSGCVTQANWISNINSVTLGPFEPIVPITVIANPIPLLFPIAPLRLVTVELVRLNSAGEEIGVIASTQTDENGEYILESPLALDENLLVRAVINDEQTLNSLVFSPLVDVNPLTEFLTTTVLSDLQLNGGNIAHISEYEFLAVLALVELESTNLSMGTTVDAELFEQFAQEVTGYNTEELIEMFSDISRLTDWFSDQLALKLDLLIGNITQDGENLPDTVPVFEPLNHPVANELVTSEPVTLEAIPVDTLIWVEYGSLSINGGDFSSEINTVNSGDTIQLQALSPSSSEQDRSVTLILGGLISLWEITLSN
jgi:hypothetical protein